jgi:hypothetical protein
MKKKFMALSMLMFASSSYGMTGSGGKSVPKGAPTEQPVKKLTKKERQKANADRLEISLDEYNRLSGEERSNALNQKKKERNSASRNSTKTSVDGIDMSEPTAPKKTRDQARRELEESLDKMKTASKKRKPAQADQEIDFHEIEPERGTSRPATQLERTKLSTIDKSDFALDPLSPLTTGDVASSTTTSIKKQTSKLDSQDTDADVEFNSLSEEPSASGSTLPESGLVASAAKAAAAAPKTPLQRFNEQLNSVARSAYNSITSLGNLEGRQQFVKSVSAAFTNVGTKAPSLQNFKEFFTKIKPNMSMPDFTALFNKLIGKNTKVEDMTKMKETEKKQTPQLTALFNKLIGKKTTTPPEIEMIDMNKQNRKQSDSDNTSTGSEKLSTDSSKLPPIADNAPSKHGQATIISIPDDN